MRNPRGGLRVTFLPLCASLAIIIERARTRGRSRRYADNIQRLVSVPLCRHLAGTTAESLFILSHSRRSRMMQQLPISSVPRLSRNTAPFPSLIRLIARPATLTGLGTLKDAWTHHKGSPSRRTRRRGCQPLKASGDCALLVVLQFTVCHTVVSSLPSFVVCPPLIYCV